MDLKSTNHNYWIIALIALAAVRRLLSGRPAASGFYRHRAGQRWALFPNRQPPAFFGTSPARRSSSRPHPQAPLAGFCRGHSAISRGARPARLSAFFTPWFCGDSSPLDGSAPTTCCWDCGVLIRPLGSRAWYGAFVAVWAVAVLVGMIGLSFRRFVLRPKALGKLSPTSGAVAFLISALMVTYLLGWRVVSGGQRRLESELVAPHPFILCVAGGDPHLEAPAPGACPSHDFPAPGDHQFHARACRKRATTWG